jgi:hypothetical protein
MGPILPEQLVRSPGAQSSLGYYPKNVTANKRFPINDLRLRHSTAGWP